MMEALIRDSLIGPHATMGDGTAVEDSPVEHSVVLENGLIFKIARLEDSLPGKGVAPGNTDDRFKAVRSLVGVGSSVGL